MRSRFVHKRLFLRITTLLVMMAFLVLTPVCAYATQKEIDKGAIFENGSGGYQAIIYDDAEVIDPQLYNSLLDQMMGITNYGNVMFYTFTGGTNNAETNAKVALQQVFGKNSSSIIFTIDFKNRKIYIYSQGAIYDVIGRSYANSITDNVYKLATNKEYYACAKEAFTQIERVLEGQRIRQPMKYVSNFLLAFIISLLITFFIARKLSQPPKVTNEEMASGAKTQYRFDNAASRIVTRTKEYSPRSKSGGHGGHGGGGHGGGGGHSF